MLTHIHCRKQCLNTNPINAHSLFKKFYYLMLSIISMRKTKKKSSSDSKEKKKDIPSLLLHAKILHSRNIIKLSDLQRIKKRLQREWPKILLFDIRMCVWSLWLYYVIPESSVFLVPSSKFMYLVHTYIHSRTYIKEHWRTIIIIVANIRRARMEVFQRFLALVYVQTKTK